MSVSGPHITGVPNGAGRLVPSWLLFAQTSEGVRLEVLAYFSILGATRVPLLYYAATDALCLREATGVMLIARCAAVATPASRPPCPVR